MTIRLLDDNTIDKIAAGEVVERPFSVVKELVENSLDSGATIITVEIKDGGTAFIRVTDNGCGIAPDDVERAFLRHATSKIGNAEDLMRIQSLGFRGEALSSIAAVSKVELITKQKSALEGIRYIIEGGRSEKPECIGAPDGTTIIARNLFYNLPVRRKFLKSAQTEGGYIYELMEHLVLSHPYISFKFIQNGHVKLSSSGNGNISDLIYKIYGREVLDEVISIEGSQDDIHISGYIGSPAFNRNSRSFETLFVNGRFVKSAVVSGALEEGYKGYLMQHKFPFGLLYITVPPEKIDINVHPTKQEIRFLDTAAISSLVFETVSESIKSHEMLKSVKLSEDNEDKAKPVLQKGMIPEPFEISRLRSEAVETDRTSPESGSGLPVTGHASSESVIVPSQEEDFFVDTRKRAVNEENSKTSESQELVFHYELPGDYEPKQLNLFEEKIITRNLSDEYNILGQIFDTYWLISFRDRLLIVDQHAAHEKIKYEHLMKQLAQKNICIQNLLPSVVVSLSAKEQNTYLKYAKGFEELGFEIEDFGDGAYAIRAVPMDLYGCDEKNMFLEVLDELIDEKIKPVPEFIADRIATRACKAAIKGNTPMHTAEAKALIDELLTLDNPYHCPHGRPTIITMSKYEMEKKFGRII